MYSGTSAGAGAAAVEAAPVGELEAVEAMVEAQGTPRRPSGAVSPA